MTIARPGAAFGAYPEALNTPQDWLERTEEQVQNTLNQARYRGFGSFKASLRRIRRGMKDLACMSEQAFGERLIEVRAMRTLDKPTRRSTEAAFSLVAFVIERQTGLTLHDEQMYGGWVMTHGLLAEMQTGEGKTLTAALPACAAALAGVPVHVITTNDYLVERDAESLSSVYKALGLTVATVLEGMSDDDRRCSYRADVVYVSNKQIVFDYLKDLQRLGQFPSSLKGSLGELLSGEETPQPVMRGLCHAIIDEADSVLIDDAQTPLVLSKARMGGVTKTVDYGVAIGLARSMKADEHFLIKEVDRALTITPAGEQKLEEMSQALAGKWRNRRFRLELLRQALSALWLYRRDEQYIVDHEKIVLIDPNTGRATPDKTLSHGLHQLIEVKEGCEVSDPTETLARLSYQQFFRRYFALSGMTGTALDVDSELQKVYGLSVVSIPTHEPTRRKNRSVRVFRDVGGQHAAIVASVQQHREQGRPVLIGTRSVKTSETISLALHEAAIPHRVLNAKQDADEASVVAQAGADGQVTVATNMAGRGTDIPLGDGVNDRGGLHVICAEMNDARRIDRQLYGRCARQGDKGSYEALLSLEDEAFVSFYPSSGRTVLKRMVSADNLVRNGISRWIARFPQWRAERRGRRQRAAVLHQQSRFFELLAYAGRNE
jgi:preprotein translocase subunit SecA